MWLLGLLGSYAGKTCAPDSMPPPPLLHYFLKGEIQPVVFKVYSQLGGWGCSLPSSWPCNAGDPNEVSCMQSICPVFEPFSWHPSHSWPPCALPMSISFSSFLFGYSDDQESHIPAVHTFNCDAWQGLGWLVRRLVGVPQVLSILPVAYISGLTHLASALGHILLLLC